MTDTHTTAHIPDEAVVAMPERIYAAKSDRHCIISMDEEFLDYNIEYVRADIAAIRALSPAELTQHPDDAAVDSFARLMKSKLAQKRKEGRSGWQGMSAEELTIILRQHVDKGDPVDVGNLCMMLSENGQSIVAAAPITEAGK